MEGYLSHALMQRLKIWKHAWFKLKPVHGLVSKQIISTIQDKLNWFYVFISSDEPDAD